MIPATVRVRPSGGASTRRSGSSTEREGEAKLLSGGYSLIPLLKLRLGAARRSSSTSRRVGGLDGIVETDDDLRIGARATHRQIHENPIVRDRYPLIQDVSGGIGDPQVRNWGTIGGSVAHADPASDWPAALLAANATIVVPRQGGERAIAARDFFLDTFTTAIEPTEVLTEIRIPRRPQRAAAAYRKLERRVGDFATVGVAAVVRLGDDGTIERVGIGVTGVSPSAVRGDRRRGRVLVGQRPSRGAVPPRRRGGRRPEPARPPTSTARPTTSGRWSREMTVRSLRTAVERARAYA